MSSEGDWSSFSGMCFTEEADFMAQLLGNCSLPNELPGSSNCYGISSGFWNGHESNTNLLGSGAREDVSVYSSNDTNNISGILFPPPSHESYYPSHSRPILMRNDSSITTERSLIDTNYNPIEADEYFLNQDNVTKDNMEPELVLDGKGLLLGRIDYDQFPQDKMDHSPSESSKKRARLHGHVSIIHQL